ncbi:hypothetical protein Cme02nite_07030 [Catellatospora methionotrophica]|uniref:Calx-beta domain-containing protein n=1 Tax=Catellatospora methionotrophica TaxID=121620 RepID=A0A8J3PEP3_9ACTN|nr:Calx-beta domain-containing protein [Catellatospora methionotrophica]GIG12371.1 hypothetical protein Cme02nite_07030 [Catellatospora methionotrophica]
MTRIARWLSASALALLAMIVLLPQPASAAGSTPCGPQCVAINRDAVCWEKEWCAVQLVVKGTPAGSGAVLRYRTADGTAVAPGDYVAVPSAEISLPAGGSTHLRVFVAGDAARERDEAFAVEFLDGDGRVLATSTVTVRDPAAY